MKFKLFYVIIAAIIALCSTSCVENVKANTESDGYVITLEHWDLIHNMSVYKVILPDSTSYTLLRDDNRGGICVLD